MRDSPSTLLVLCTCLALAQGQLTNITITVFISGLNATTDQDQDRVVFVRDLDGRQFQAAVDLAVEAVNNHSQILEGYNLQVEYVDSQCSAGPSVQGFIDQIFDSTGRLLIIGSDCSTATEPVAELAPFWGLVQISPLSSGPNLVTVDSPFTTFLRLVPSDAAAAMGVVSLMEQFNWTRLGIITQQESSFTFTANRLMELFGERNFTTYSHTFNTGDNPVHTFHSLLNSPARIIFLNVYPSYALEILCQAYRMGRTFSAGYLWLLYPWYPQAWWTTGPVYDTTCQSEEIQSALDRAIIIDYFPLSDEARRDEETAAGLTRAQYERLLRERIDEVGADNSFFNLTHLYFDAVLMGALALNTTNTMYDISMFNFNTTDMISANITSTVLAAAMGRSFMGVSGSVDLGGNREIAPVIRFRQYRMSGNQLESVFIGNASYFQNTDEVFPSPGTPTDEQYVFISEPLFIVYTILSCVGILFALAVALFLCVFRQRTVIRLSSPLLNMLIIGGTVLFYTDIILFGIDMGTASFTTVTALCMIRMWVATFAFSLLFGPIFLKTWRVYYAFFSRNKDKKRKVKIVPDWVLFVAMGVLLLVDVVFMLFVTVFPDARLSLENQNVEVSATSPDLPQRIGVCTAPHSNIWIIVLFVYKGLPLLIGLFLAFETRNSKIRQLNDSKVIGMSVYCVAILSFAVAVIGVLTQQTPDVFYGVIGILIIVCNTTVLCLLLIPKFYALRKDPEGLRVLSSPEPRHSSEVFDSIAGLNDEVEKLKQELNELNSPRARENMSIDDLSRTIDDSNGGSVQVLFDKKTVHFTPSAVKI